MNNNFNNFNKFTIQSSFAISAGAGSGKTYTLSRRYINAVLGFDFFTDNTDKTTKKNWQQNYIERKEKNKADVSQIVTMTYTEAAALEMKERIFDLMEKIIDFDKKKFAIKDKQRDKDLDSVYYGLEGLKDEDKQYVQNSLQTALHNSNTAFISTIHSFCLDTISSNSDIAKLDAKISIIQDDEKQKILDEVRLETLTKHDTLAIEIFKQNDRFKVNQLIEKYATNSKFRESFNKFIDKSLDIDTYKQMIYELYPLPEVSEELFNEISNDTKTLEWIEKYIQNFKDFKAVVWKDVAKEEAPTLKKDTLLKEWTITSKTALKSYSIYTQAIDEDKEIKFNTQVSKIQELLKLIHTSYIQRLKTENKIDFDAIISITKEIVDKKMADEVKSNYKYIMVDEFQDTNSLQNDIVNAISKDINLFIVGDSKQSIYSFQGAELEVFNNAVNIKGNKPVPMSTNYRSDKKILTFVNDVFQELFEQEDDTNKLISSNFKAIFTDDDKLKPSSEDKADGKVEFLISQEDGYQIIDNQMKDIAKFVKAIKDGGISGYEKIKEKIDAKEKAIGIVFDSKTKMLELKKELDFLGVECKVSATENFYHTREINDIFLTLKSIELLNRKEYSKDPKKLFPKEKFYIAGALRSNILRYDEKRIVELLNGDMKDIVNIFTSYIETSKILPISQLIKHIVDSSKLLDVYTYLGDLHQRSANIEKLIDMTISFESNNSGDLFKYLEDLERSIYFNKDVKEDEAFYKSENLESIELCTIHSTKGLAYPMVILAQSEKGLSASASGEMGLSFSSFTLQQNSKSEDYSAVGFKIDDYEPLVYRILKQVMKNKHKAEKKRLLYVALTRAEHNLVIAGSTYRSKSSGEIGLSDNCYLSWLTKKSFDIEKEILFKNTENDKIIFVDKEKFKDIQSDPIFYSTVKYTEEEVVFKEYSKKTASNTNDEKVLHENITKQANIGTAIHSILERYWNKLDEDNIFDTIYLRYSIFEEDAKEKIKRYINNFKNTTTYKALQNGAEHHFEMELNIYKEDKQTQGIIDLVYFDKEKDGLMIVDFKSNNISKIKDLVQYAKENEYVKQLDTYEELCEDKDMRVVGKVLLFLDDGGEIEF